MKQFSCGSLNAVLIACALAVAGALPAIEIDVGECPTCDTRMHIARETLKVKINMSRLKADNPSAEVLAARVNHMKQRAAKLVALAESTKTPNPKRPLMGWASWNAFGCDITDALIYSQAEVMATNGLKAAGYRYINIDDGAFGGRDKEGHIIPNPSRFPKGFKDLVTKIHALGLKAGTYSDGGESTCAGLFNGDVLGLGTGLYRHEKMDSVDRFLKDGFDFIKIDWCGGRKLGLSREQQYTRIARAIAETRPDVHMNVCCWAYPGIWVGEVAGSWRVCGDIRANWRSLRRALMDNFYRAPYCKPGHFNDMDMMQVGRLVGQTKQARFKEFKSDTGLTRDEETTHFAMWCMLSSPLMLGCDLREMPATTLQLVTNPFILATSQNDLGLAGVIARTEGNVYAFVKDADERFGTARYVAVLNLDDAEKSFVVRGADYELGGPFEVFDLVAGEDLGEYTDTLGLRVPAHGTRLLRLDAQKRLERSLYEAETAFLTKFGRRGEVANYAARGDASGGKVVGFLGKDETNDLIWKDVNILTAGPRELEFRFAAFGTRFFDLQIDDGAKQRLEAISARHGMSTLRVPVTFTAGRHTVRLSNATDWAPDFDYMRILPPR